VANPQCWGIRTVLVRDHAEADEGSQDDVLRCSESIGEVMQLVLTGESKGNADAVSTAVRTQEPRSTAQSLSASSPSPSLAAGGSSP
jgi:hypothetical protein